MKTARDLAWSLMFGGASGITDATAQVSERDDEIRADAQVELRVACDAILECGHLSQGCVMRAVKLARAALANAVPAEKVKGDDDD